MKVGVSFHAVLAFSLVAFATLAWADDWPGFRGGKGGVSPDQDLPTQVTKENVHWKVKLPGVGTSMSRFCAGGRRRGPRIQVAPFILVSPLFRLASRPQIE